MRQAMTDRCLVKSKNNCHLSSLKTSEVLTLQASTSSCHSQPVDIVSNDNKTTDNQVFAFNGTLIKLQQRCTFDVIG